MPHRYTPGPHRTEPEHATWIVAADAGRARIFRAVQADGELEELADFVNPDARLQDHEAMSDRRGHVVQGVAGVGHSFEPRQTHGEHIAESFAKDLCQRLGTAQRKGEVAKIYLIADPRFLGLLRKNLDRATHQLVVQETAADFSRSPVSEIRGVLPARL